MFKLLRVPAIVFGLLFTTCPAARANALGLVVSPSTHPASESTGRAGTTLALSRPSSPANPPAQELLVGTNNTVRCYSGTTGDFVSSFVGPGSGGLSLVQNIAIGPDGDLYASDFATGQVKRYDGATRAFIDDFAQGGGLSHPDQLAFGPDGNLYVSDRFTGRILRYDASTGVFIDAFVEDFRLGGFVGFTFGPDGNIYAGEFNGDDVLRFNGTTGAFMDVFATAPPELVSDAGITFGPDGNLYVAGLNSDNVLRFNGTTGAFMDDFVPAGSGGLDAADYIAFGPDGNLYVDSQLTHSVNRYDGVTGAFIKDFVIDPALSPPKGLVFRAAGGPACGPISVRVDIKPGSQSNPIKLSSHGVVPVAILSTDSFDAATINPSTVCFGDAEDASQRDCREAHGKGHIEDVDGDGTPDLLLHFKVSETGIDPGDTEACLSGETFDGIVVEGCDPVHTL